MKKKIALVALIMISLFSLLTVSNNSANVYACDAPLPQICNG